MADHPIRALIVDDERFALKLLQRQLERLGVREIAAFVDARDAIDLLERDDEAINVVFCDLQMPRVDGVQFVRELARIGYSGSLALISGEDKQILRTAERLAKAYRLHVSGALEKPVSLDALRKLLDLEPERAIRPKMLRPRGYHPDELRRALANGELLNVYQPKVEFESGEIRGVEALVRWQHPKDGMVGPDQFIAMAEDSGLVDELTMGVLDRALAAASHWHRNNLPLHVAVNISMECLTTLDLPDLVENKAKAAGIHRSSLVLEVTESRLTKDARKALDILTRLRLKRVNLSIDDFGTGQSSLAQLRDFPFNELKIDRGFVHGACRDRTRAAMLAASLGIARQLGICSVGEGVEDRDDWEFLRAQGCDLAQGYFIARPMKGEQLLGWAKTSHNRRRKLAVRSA